MISVATSDRKVRLLVIFSKLMLCVSYLTAHENFQDEDCYVKMFCVTHTHNKFSDKTNLAFFHFTEIVKRHVSLDLRQRVSDLSVLLFRQFVSGEETFWDRRILGLGDLCLRLSFWSKCSDPLLFSQGSAAPTLLFLWAGQCSFSLLFGVTGQ